MRRSMVKFPRIGQKEDLVIYAVGDASYKLEGLSIGGSLVMLGNKYNDNVSPLFWKSKQIQKVCHSAKDAETRNVMAMVDTSLYLKQQLSMLLFGKSEHEIPLYVYTDSRPLLDSIASTKQVDQRLLRNTMMDLNKRLEDKEVTSYSWIGTKAMVADILTKESGEIENILEVMRENIFRKAHSQQNRVVWENGEIVMKNVVVNVDEFDQDENLDQTKTRGEY